MKTAHRLIFALLWLAALIAGGFAISQRLQVSGDLRKFMPGQGKNRRVRVPKAARAAGGIRATMFFAAVPGVGA
jgi:predicted exporter